MEKIRVGIIGIGNIGSVHTESILRGDVTGMELSALCDNDPQKIKYLKEKYPNIPIYSDHMEMLKSGITDAVIISTPHKFHPIIAEDAFSCGNHVLSEKPAGVDTKTVEKMYETARGSGKEFGIMFNQRTDPLFAKAREIVKSGKLGEPKRLVWIITNWYRSQAYYDSGSWRATWNGEGGGVLLNQAPHNLDLWQWIFGMPKRIRAFCYNGKYHDIAVEDDATVYAEYENGATATFITSTGEYPGTNRLEISGTLGRMVIEHGELVFTELSCSEREYCLSFETMEKPTETEHRYKDANDVSGHTLILRNFTEHILNGKELIAPGYDGINELILSNAAYLSSYKDDWVDIPLNGDEFLEMLNEYRRNEVVKKKEKNNEPTETEYKDRWQVRWN